MDMTLILETVLTAVALMLLGSVLTLLIIGLLAITLPPGKTINLGFMKITPFRRATGSPYLPRANADDPLRQSLLDIAYAIVDGRKLGNPVTGSRLAIAHAIARHFALPWPRAYWPNAKQKPEHELIDLILELHASGIPCGLCDAEGGKLVRVWLGGGPIPLWQNAYPRDMLARAAMYLAQAAVEQYPRSVFAERRRHAEAGGPEGDSKYPAGPHHAQAH